MSLPRSQWRLCSPMRAREQAVAVCSKLYGALIARNGGSMRRQGPSRQLRQRVGRSFDVVLVRNAVYGVHSGEVRRPVFEAGSAFAFSHSLQCRQKSLIGRCRALRALKPTFVWTTNLHSFKKKPTTCHSKKMSLNVWNKVTYPSSSI